MPTATIKVEIYYFSMVFLLIRPPLAFSLSFNLSQIGPQHTNTFIKLEGDAYISNQGLHLTPDDRYNALIDKVGRATYFEKLKLWNKVSGNLIDFSTHFSFVIDSGGKSNYADGLAFFLAPIGSILLPNSHGGTLGLQNQNSTENIYSQPYAAVEFDTFQNDWDPDYGSINISHVGININSLKSVATAQWPADVSEGVQNDVWITYAASSKTLWVGFNSTSHQGTQYSGILSYVIDLREHLPEDVVIGFSGATGWWFEKNNIKSWEFSSTLLPEKQLPAPTPSPQPAAISDPRLRPSPQPAAPALVTANDTIVGNKNQHVLVVTLSVTLPLLVVVLPVATYFLWMRCKKESGDEGLFDPSMDMEFEMGRGPQEFTYTKLFHATKKFAESEKLGEGGFGGVYKGWLQETNSYIAVKRVSRESKQGLKEYQAEVKIISQLRHKNLVQLIGWCHKKRGELLLVYEFMPNGSLDSHLFKGRSMLTWELRYKIGKGLASVLLYLHEEGIKCVVHRDIKSSNIMLDSNFEAKLGDFGLAKLIEHDKSAQTTTLAGTRGYLAPECAITGKANKESDVYSFGVVLLEIGCGKRPRNYNSTKEFSLVEWVWNLYGIGRLLDAADPKLDNIFDELEMVNLLVVGLWCAHPDNQQRPSIRKAVQVLNFDAELPLLPNEMPVATYNTAPVCRSSSGIIAHPPHHQYDPVSYNNNNSSSGKTASSFAGSTATLLHYSS